MQDQINAGTLPANVKTMAEAGRLLVNDRVDAAVAGFFMISVVIVIAASASEWLAVILGRKPAISTEIPFEPRAVAVGD